MPSLLRRALGEAERAALGIAADCPALAWMNHLPAELDHARNCRVEIQHFEVRERSAVAGPRPALVQAELDAVGTRLETAALPLLPLVQGRAEQPLPELPRPLQIVSGEFDQLEHEGRV